MDEELHPSLRLIFNQRLSTTLGAAASTEGNTHLGWEEPLFPLPSSVSRAWRKALLSHGILTSKLVCVCDTVFLSADNSSPKMDSNPVVDA